MLVGDIRLKKTWEWRFWLRSKMQTEEFFANSSCSKQFNQGLDNQRIAFSVINMLLEVAAIVGNAVILIALHKETSLHKPSKVLLRNLVASYLCVGFVQLVFVAYVISILQRQWQICRLFYLVFVLSGTISIAVSLWTITAISVDRLLAMLLKVRYREVVSLRKVNIVAIASWICNGIGFGSLWYFSHNTRKVLSVLTIAVCLFTSTYSYTRIFIRLRHQHNQNASLKSSRSRDSNNSNGYNTIQKDSVQRSVASISNVVLLFAVFVAGVVRLPKKYSLISARYPDKYHINLNIF